MPTLPTGLKRDPKSAVYYLRRRIPSDVLTFYSGKTELTWSLKTKDYKTAVERHRQDEAKLTSQWAKYREQQAEAVRVHHQAPLAQKITILTPDMVDAICGRFEASSLTSDEYQRQEEQYSVEDIHAYKAGYTGANSELKMAMAMGDTSRLIPLLNLFLYMCRIELDVPEADIKRLAMEFGRTAIRVNEKLLKRFDGEDVPTPKPAHQCSATLLSEVAKAYTAYYEKLNKPQMLKKVNAVLPLMLKLIGNKPIWSLTQTDFTTFFDDVQNLPPRWKDYCRIHDITPKEVAALQIGEISKGTFDSTYVAVIGPFLDYCHSRWQDQGWPVNISVEGIKYIGSRSTSENGQRAFRHKELSRLFAGPEMEELAASPADAFKFWLPHVGLFTGARANELCQLNPQSDIKMDEDSGIWYLDLSASSESHAEIRKALKNDTSKRKVPIHPTLLKLGFLEYVAHLKATGQTLLFPGFPPSVGRAAPKAGEWFTELLKRTGLRDETPGARLVGMHAFRHTLSNQAEELGVVNTEAITGHANKVTNIETTQNGMINGAVSTVVRKYKGELSVAKKMEIIKQIHYGGLEFFKPSLGKPNFST